MRKIFVALLMLLVILSGCNTAEVSDDESIISENEIVNTTETEIVNITEGEIVAEESVSQPDAEQSYIANKSTKKLHYSRCHSVELMTEKNKRYLTCTRDEASESGYKLCKKCNP